MWSRWESGTRLIDPFTAVRISEEYGMSIEYLYIGTSKRQEHEGKSSQIEKRLKVLKALTDMALIENDEAIMKRNKIISEILYWQICFESIELN